MGLNSTEETAVKLRVSSRTLYRLRVAGKGPEVTQIGGRPFHSDAAIADYLARCRR